MKLGGVALFKRFWLCIRKNQLIMVIAEWSAIWSEIICMISKSNKSTAGV